MKNEAEFKSIFKKSVRAQKGFSISLAAPTLPGTPDLYVIIPGYVPVLLEAKYLGTVNNLKFKRKLQFTPMQRHYLKECCRVADHTALGLIGFKYKKMHVAVLVSPDEEHLSNDFDSYPWIHYVGGTFNVLDLFSMSSIPKMNGYHAPTVDESYQIPPGDYSGIA